MTCKCNQAPSLLFNFRRERMDVRGSTCTRSRQRDWERERQIVTQISENAIMHHITSLPFSPIRDITHRTHVQGLNAISSDEGKPQNGKTGGGFPFSRHFTVSGPIISSSILRLCAASQLQILQRITFPLTTSFIPNYSWLCLYYILGWFIRSEAHHFPGGETTRDMPK